MAQMTIQEALQLAIQHHQMGRFAEALAIYQRVLAVNPAQADALHLMGVLLFESGQIEESLNLINQAIALRPPTPLYFSSQGRVLFAAGRIDEAIVSYRRSIELDPTLRDTHHNLANAQHLAGQYEQAAELFRQVLAAQPHNVNALNDFANLLADAQHPTEAIRYYRAALSVDPTRAEVFNNLANRYKEAGQIDQAIECYRQMLALQPDSPDVHSNLLLAMNYLPQADHGLLAEHQAWAKLHAEKFYRTLPADITNRSPDRRLRIGYVSADFRQHAAANFFQPILAHHDRQKCEIFCYSNVARPDEMTQRLQDQCEQWRPIKGLSDDRVAQMIREDQIDILVDLSGHTAGHRLLVIARKPAPIQVTYLGYPNTTGLPVIDYRISDEQADPVGMTEPQHTEQLIRLPAGFLCFAPPCDAPTPMEKGDTNQPITFGTFNQVAKITSEMIAVWSRILLAVPDSRMLLKGDCFLDPVNCQALRQQFQSHGVQPSAIELIGRVPSIREHLALYHRMDIALDTFPYHGTTTTCDAMWMGVPVVTLAGHAHVSRVGVSLLTRVGLTDLIAMTPDAYVAIAVQLAHDPRRRIAISGSSLRTRMERSQLMDGYEFVRSLEDAYREMWRVRCLQ